MKKIEAIIKPFRLDEVKEALTGIGTCFVWTFCTAFIMFKLIDKTIGLRVSPEEEAQGLDRGEHGGNAYPDFEVSSYAQQ